MTSLLIKHEVFPIPVNASAILPQEKMTTEQFYAFCADNPDWCIERTAEGDVIVMPPAFSDTGNRNFEIAVEVGIWARQNGTGKGFDSSAGFTLPNGAVRSPDAAWIKLARWNALTAAQKASFAPICPDFVIELKSNSDSLASLQSQMTEYIDNGTLLGLLIDRQERTVCVYRPEHPPEVLKNPDSVSCDPELPGFALLMEKIW